MIISCKNCYKKYEIDSDLIPDKGRLLECANCNNQWFYKKNQIVEKIVPKEQPLEAKSIKNPKIDTINFEEKVNKVNKIQKKEPISSINNLKEFPQNSLNISKNINDDYKIRISSLNVILISIISFIALIILIDTFQKPISLVIPNIEFILYNLYETTKDIFLFSKDLIS